VIKHAKYHVACKRAKRLLYTDTGKIPVEALRFRRLELSANLVVDGKACRSHRVSRKLDLLRVEKLASL
jgi:hypothetical protein